MKAYLAILVLAAACGSDSKSNNDANTGGSNDGAVSIDAKEFLDAPPNVPAMITLTGTTTEVTVNGRTPLAGVQVQAFRSSDDATAIATATSDAQGNFSLTVMTNGVPVDGYLKATKANYITAYLYPPTPLVADFNNATVFTVTTDNFNFLSVLAQGNQDPNNGVVAVVVLDASNMPVAGATVSSNPASNPYRYNGTNGAPNSQATSTAADGIGYMFNAPVGSLTVTAAKTGTTFHSHVVKAFKGALTETVIQP